MLCNNLRRFLILLVFSVLTYHSNGYSTQNNYQYPPSEPPSKQFNNIVIQILGAPASGKSGAMEQVIQALSKQELKDDFQKIKSIDLDIERENIARLPGTTQLFLMYKALKLFKDASKKEQWPNYHLNEIVKFINGKLKELFEFQGVNIVYDNNQNSLIIDSKVVTDQNFGEISEQIQDKSNIVFKQLGPWDLLIHLNRYIQLQVMMESMYLYEDVQLDEVGGFASPILERLSKLRKRDYGTLTILIHPKNIGVNLLLNSIRTAKGNHLADPDYLFKQYDSLQRMIDNKTDYFAKAEKVLTISDSSKFGELENQIMNISTSDNNTPENKDKDLDLLVVINTLDMGPILNSLTDNEDFKRKVLGIMQASIIGVKYKLPDSKPIMEKIEGELRKLNMFLSMDQVIEQVNKVSQENKYIRESELFKLMTSNENAFRTLGSPTQVQNSSTSVSINNDADSGNDCSKLTGSRRKECEWNKVVREQQKPIVKTYK